jgi:hypothetical protein
LHPHASGSGGGPPAPYPLSSPGPLLVVLAVPLLLRVLFPLLVLSLLGLLPLLVIGVPLGLLRPLSLVLRRAGTTPTGRCTPCGGQRPRHILAEVGSHEPVGCERELHQVPGVIRRGVLPLHCAVEAAVHPHQVHGMVLPGVQHLLKHVHSCHSRGHSVCVEVHRVQGEVLVSGSIGLSPPSQFFEVEALGRDVPEEHPGPYPHRPSVHEVDQLVNFSQCCHRSCIVSHRSFSQPYH